MTTAANQIACLNWRLAWPSCAAKPRKGYEMGAPTSWGWEMTLVKYNGDREEWHCLARSEKVARRKAMLRRHVERVEDVRQISRQSYVTTYGDPTIHT